MRNKSKSWIDCLTINPQLDTFASYYIIHLCGLREEKKNTAINLGCQLSLSIHPSTKHIGPLDLEIRVIIPKTLLFRGPREPLTLLSGRSGFDTVEFLVRS